MAFQSCPEIAEFVIGATTIGGAMANVIHARKPGGYDIGALQTAVEDLDGYIGSDLLPIIGSAVNYTGVVARGLELENDLTVSANTSAGSGSMAGSFTLPSNCAFCVTLRSDKTGKSARGRYYMFPPADTALAAVDTVTNTYRDLAVSYVRGLGSLLSESGWQWVVLSRVSNKIVRPVGIGFPITVTEARNNTMDSQRGRLPHNH